MEDFIHLRVISSYSLCYGAMTIDKSVSLAKQFQMPALAISERGNFFGLLEFSLNAVKESIQPIIACSVKIEISENNFDEILLIAKNEEGYQNLIKIVSLSFITSSNSQAKSNLDNLKKYNNGLICLIGYREGKIYELLASSQTPQAQQIISAYQDIFNNDIFIEISRLGYKNEQYIENKLLQIAKTENIPIVATNDVKYASSELSEAQEILSCIADNRYYDDSNRSKINSEHYFKSPTAMKSLFKDLPEAIENTIIIAKKCSYFPKANDPALPKYGNGENTEDGELSFQSKQGLEIILEKNKILDKAPYYERLNYELSIITKMGFAGYFLIVSDFIKWSKKNKIPVGPGRGSGAGSIVAWVLQITDLDPLRFGLLFERFLNPERVSMPDFDIDFCQDRREEVIDYVKNKYGKDRVAQIITFGKLQAKAVLKDVGRVMQIPYNQVDRISKMIPFNPVNPVTLAEAIEMDPLLQQERKNDPQIAKLLNISLKLEGLHRHASTHAAGIVISNKKLLDLIPLYKDPRSDMPVVQYSMKYTELSGLVKFDFLGLKTLTVIAKAVEYLAEQNIIINIHEIKLDDINTYNMLGKGNSIGVFQLESAGMRDCLKKMRPDKLEDLIALISLYRPGPMDNIPKYIETKHGKAELIYPHPLLEECLKETFGVIIYQEQVMQIAQILAGYSLGEADLLRRAMGKKIKKEMDAQREIFINGAKKNNISNNKASEIFDLVAKFAGYGFNKSHAAAYALIGYQTAYLKANFPVEFIVATLNLDYHDTDKINLFIQEAKKLKIKILPPDINESSAYFKVDISNKQKSIRYGLGALKSVGLASILELEKIRNINNFSDINDFVQRAAYKIFQKRQLESLIKAGALDILESNRAKLLNSVEYIIKYAQNYQNEQNSNQHSLFSSDSDSSVMKLSLPEKQDFSLKEKLMNEFNAFGFYLTEHPLDRYQEIINQDDITTSDALIELNNSSKDITIMGVIISYKQRSGKNGRFVTLNISDHKGIIDVSIFDDELISNSRDLLYNGSVIVIKANFKSDSNGSRVISNQIISLDNYLAEKSIPIEIETDNTEFFAEIKENTTYEDADFPAKFKISYVWNGYKYKIKTNQIVKITDKLAKKLQEYQ
jgi:DNA polymerase-3 subunit alpha